MLPNPCPIKHSPKEEFAQFCITPFIELYINKHNHEVDKKTTTCAQALALRDVLNKYITKHRLPSINPKKLTVDCFIKEYLNIPNRGVKSTRELFRGVHLNFTLLWSQMALLDFAENTGRKPYHIVAKPSDELLNKAIDRAKMTNLNTTVIRELLRDVCYYTPSELLFWAVLEIGDQSEKYHIHLIAALDDKEKITFKAAFKNFEVQFLDKTNIGGVKFPIDMGAAGYLAKEVNNMYFESRNVFINHSLKKSAKRTEKVYREFIKEHKRNIFDNVDFDVH
jgi:hypothetical protein